MLNSRTRQACLATLVGGFLILFLGLITFIGGGARCGGDTGVMAGNTCVTTNGGDYRSTARKITQAELDDVRRSQRALGKGGMVLGSLLILGAAGFAARDGRSRRPLRARVSLTPEQARGGGATSVRFRARPHCSHCSGTGTGAGGAGRRCPRCWGSGLGRSRLRTLTVRIPVGVRDGSTLRARGRAHRVRAPDRRGTCSCPYGSWGRRSGRGRVRHRPGSGRPPHPRTRRPAPPRLVAGRPPHGTRAAVPSPSTPEASGSRRTGSVSPSARNDAPPEAASRG